MNTIAFLTDDECTAFCTCPKCGNDGRSQTWKYEDNPVYKLLVELYGEPFGEGKDRITFDCGNGWVVKFPKESYGVEANYKEEKNHALWPDKTAKCHIKMVDDIPLIHMEKVIRVNTWESYYDLPPWCKGTSDGGQVGLTKDGRLVLYDYGHTLDHYCMNR